VGSAAVNLSRPPALPLAFVAALSLAGCFSTNPRPSAADISAVPAMPAIAAPPNTQAPQATVPAEPKSRYGNPPFYEVFGKRYYVLSSSTAYVERGVASWYGPGFHRIRTSNGETYDMYGMSAAHKTLPLPAFVRVTNLLNGRSVVVRVNDRGPFVGNRIIDLSYTAAARLDMLRGGTAMVEIRTLDPGTPLTEALHEPLQAEAAVPPGAVPVNPASPAMAQPVAPPAATPIAPPVPAPVNPAAIKRVLFVQAGAFADPANAERLAAKLRSGAYGKILVRDDQIAGRRMYRVRIGPVPDVQSFDRIYAALERDGVHDAHLALD